MPDKTSDFKEAVTDLFSSTSSALQHHDESPGRNKAFELMQEATGICNLYASDSQGHDTEGFLRQLGDCLDKMAQLIADLGEIEGLPPSLGDSHEDVASGSASFRAGETSRDRGMTINGLDVMESLDAPLASGNAIWMGTQGPKDIVVIGEETEGDLACGWNFGAEWNGNVARNVSFCCVRIGNDADATKVTVLFNESFDENAVDVTCANGTTHLLLVQGLVASSLGELWNGVRYRASRQQYGETDVSAVVFPTMAICERLDDGRRDRISLSVTCGETMEARASEDKGVDADIPRIWFDDVFSAFVYESPYEGYVTRRDLMDVEKPDAALLVTDIKCLQEQAERLTDYDPYWGKDIIP